MTMSDSCLAHKNAGVLDIHHNSACTVKTSYKLPQSPSFAHWHIGLIILGDSGTTKQRDLGRSLTYHWKATTEYIIVFYVTEK